MAICPTKKAGFLAHFEALELSYPIITFPGYFWNLKNLGMSVRGAPIFEKNDIQSRVPNGPTLDNSEIIGIDSGAP